MHASPEAGDATPSPLAWPAGSARMGRWTRSGDRISRYGDRRLNDVSRFDNMGAGGFVVLGERARTAVPSWASALKGVCAGELLPGQRPVNRSNSFAVTRSTTALTTPKTTPCSAAAGKMTAQLLALSVAPGASSSRATVRQIRAKTLLAIIPPTTPAISVNGSYRRLIVTRSTRAAIRSCSGAGSLMPVIIWPETAELQWSPQLLPNLLGCATAVAEVRGLWYGERHHAG